MNANYDSFLSVVGALAQLVVVATVLERALAFIFEHEWFIRLTTRKVRKAHPPVRKEKQADGVDDRAQGEVSVQETRENIIPGLKGCLSLAAAMGIALHYDMDILAAIFSPGDPQAISQLGSVVTGFVLAGGSAGAITIFQGYLGISKESRDALIDSREAEAKEQVAASEARQKSAEADRLEAEARLATTRLQLERADLERAELERKRLALNNGQPGTPS